MSIKGVGETKAAMIMAALEYFKRHYIKSDALIVDSPEKAVAELSYIKNKKQEHFVMLTLDGARRLINNRIVSIGTMMQSLVHHREVFSYAIEDRAASIIVAHNHPSGILEISKGDRDVTERLRLSGEIIGINLDDHLILSGEDFISVM